MDIDLNDPEVTQKLMALLLDSVPWSWLIGIAAVSILVGALIGFYKGALWRDTLLGALLGPIGWLISLALPSSRLRCATCGHANHTHTKCCNKCGSVLSHISTHK